MIAYSIGLSLIILAKLAVFVAIIVIESLNLSLYIGAVLAMTFALIPLMVVLELLAFAVVFGPLGRSSLRLGSAGLGRSD